jgi:hypothetical protein
MNKIRHSDLLLERCRKWLRWGRPTLGTGRLFLGRYRRWLDRYRVWLAVFATVSIVTFIASLWLKPDEFLFHFFIEMSIAAVTLIVTVLVVEDMLEHRRKMERDEHWAVIRQTTLMELTASVGNVVLWGPLLLKNGRGNNGNKLLRAVVENERIPTKEVTELMKDLIDELTKEKILNNSGCYNSEALAGWQRQCEKRLDIILQKIIPRMIQFAPGHPIMKNLLDLESHHPRTIQFITGHPTINSLLDLENHHSAGEKQEDQTSCLRQKREEHTSRLREAVLRHDSILAYLILKDCTEIYTKLASGADKFPQPRRWDMEEELEPKEL